MPSEAELCRELHVSRVTLRKAISQLERDGWITLGGRGRHHRIRKPVKAPHATTGRIVRVLIPYTISAIGSAQNTMIETVAEHLGRVGYRLEYEHRPALFSRHSPSDLKRLATLPDTAAWILFFSTLQMQRWYAQNAIPCLVIGRLHEGVKLPSIRLDISPISRHAAGLFYQRGHRELAYLIAEFTSLNDRLASEAFAEEAQRLGARARIVTHPREPAGLTRALDLLLRSRPRPTAFFSTCPEHCVTILCYLREVGLRVPKDASIISGGDDEFLQFALPKFACYRVDAPRMGRKAAEAILSLIRQGGGRMPSFRFLPAFIPGGTLGPLPGVRRAARS